MLRAVSGGKEDVMLEIRSKALNQAFKRLPAPAFIINEKRTIVAMNLEAARVVGLRAGDVIGKMTCRKVCKCRLAIADCPLGKALEEPASAYKMRVEMAPNGRKRTVVERLHAFCDSDTGEKRAAMVLIGSRQ
jgi:hypothetical protein